MAKARQLLAQMRWGILTGCACSVATGVVEEVKLNPTSKRQEYSGQVRGVPWAESTARCAQLAALQQAAWLLGTGRCRPWG